MRRPSFNRALATLSAIPVLTLSAQVPPPEGEATKSTADPLTSSTHQTSYNECGQLTRLVQPDPGGKAQTRQFTYDTVGRLTSQTEPETQTTTFGDFDALGQPGTITDASHRTIRRTFDGLGRLQSVNSGTRSLSAFYRGPFLVGLSSADGVDQTFTYGGPEGGMDTETLTIDGVKRYLGYSYDPNGRLAQVIYPSGRVVGYSFDRLGRISKITNNGALLVEVGYEGRGARTILSFASGAKSVWTLDDSGRHWQAWTVTFAGGSETRKYQYDALNHLTECGEWTLQHDAQGRLTSAQGHGLSATYGYDAFGNNITHTLSGSHPSTFKAFSFGSLANNRIPETQTNGAITWWVVQANGEASQVGTGVSRNHWLSLGWDDLGRLAEVTDSLTGSVQRYRYAPSGLRVSLTDSADASRNRQFLYSDDGLLLGEYQGNGTWERDVIYLGAQAIAEVDGQGVHELHADHLGTPRVITSGSSAAVEGRQAFGPYGESFDPSEASTGYQPLTGYTGHLQTDATGLIYMRGRFYTPAWHRFLNPDHGMDASSWNQYAYVGGSPLHRADPTGFMDGDKDHGGFKWDGGDRYSATVEVTGDYDHDVSPADISLSDHRDRAEFYRPPVYAATSTGSSGSYGGTSGPATGRPRPALPGWARRHFVEQTQTALKNVNEWLEKTCNQMMGIGRITDAERPLALARLDMTEPQKAQSIRIAIAAGRMPIFGCGLTPAGGLGNVTQNGSIASSTALTEVQSRTSRNPRSHKGFRGFLLSVTANAYEMVTPMSSKALA